MAALTKGQAQRCHDGSMSPASQNPANLGSQAEFSAVLSAAIAQRDLTLNRIVQRLQESGTPVSIATLSYWQTGRSLPTRTRSLRVLQELEKILRVPAGHLTGALPPQGAARWEAAPKRPQDQRISETLASLGFRPEPDFTNQTLQDSIDVSMLDATQSETTRQLLRSEVADLHRIPLVLRQDDSSQALPAVEPLAGCSLAEVVPVDDNGLVIAVLELLHPLARGGLSMIEYRVLWDISDEGDFGFARAVPRPIGHLVIDVRFLDRVPRSATYTLHPGREDEHLPTASQPMEATDFVQVAITNPAPGVHQIGWEF